MSDSAKNTVCDEKTLTRMLGQELKAEIAGNELDLDWYSQWVERRIQQIPHAVKDNIHSFETVSRKVALAAKECCSIQEIAEELVQCKVVAGSESLSALDTARAITFSLLGWQSMLFDPVVSTKPSSRIDIADTLNGFESSAFASRTIYYPSFASPLPDLLIGFGLMLPKGNLCISPDDHDVEAFEKVKTVTPGALNAFTLCKLVGITFKWIDVMGPHLEYDRQTHTVYLYRFPSFCLANLGSATDELQQGTTLYGLATKDHHNRRWASEDDVSQLLREIMLSYRLLFAQDRSSRIFFQSIKGVDEEQRRTIDPFLNRICGAERFDDTVLSPDRESYWLNRDFPILRMRLAVLQHQLSSVKPTGWRAIWTDKRDSVQWYTFWAVILFGGAGLILGTLQVIFQGIQTFNH